MMNSFPFHLCFKHRVKGKRYEIVVSASSVQYNQGLSCAIEAPAGAGWEIDAP